MAIALDTTTKSSSSSFSHTCTGVNLMLFVAIADDASGVTGVTYNSVSMTQVDSQPDGVAATTVYLFMLANPATGSNTVQINGSVGAIFVCAGSYTGVKNTLDSHNKGSNSLSGSGLSVATTVVASSCWLVGAGTSFGSQGFNMTLSGSTTRQNSVFNTQKSAAFGDSNGTVSTGSQSLTFIDSGAAGPYYGAIVVSIAPQVVITKTATASVSNAASRVATVAKLHTVIKTASTSVSNSASRLATVARVRTLVKSLSASVSNAASRLAAVVGIVLKGWSTITKSTDTFSSPQTHSSTTFTTQSKSSDSWTKQNHA